MASDSLLQVQRNESTTPFGHELTLPPTEDTVALGTTEIGRACTAVPAWIPDGVTAATCAATFASKSAGHEGSSAIAGDTGAAARAAATAAIDIEFHFTIGDDIPILPFP